MDIFEGKNKRYCKRLTKFGRNVVLRIKPRAAMFVVRFANLSLARYLTNPRVIAWLPALKGPLEPRLLTEILLFWASLTAWQYCRPYYGFRHHLNQLTGKAVRNHSVCMGIRWQITFSQNWNSQNLWNATLFKIVGKDCIPQVFARRRSAQLIFLIFHSTRSYL